MLCLWKQSTRTKSEPRHKAKVIYYRPPTKLRKGDVFTGVCLSTGRGVGYLWWQVPSCSLVPCLFWGGRVSLVLCSFRGGWVYPTALETLPSNTLLPGYPTSTQVYLTTPVKGTWDHRYSSPPSHRDRKIGPYASYWNAFLLSLLIRVRFGQLWRWHSYSVLC